MRRNLPLQPGAVVDGRFRIEELIGEGGFSTVFRAIQESVGRPVAIKVMKTDVGAKGKGQRKARLDKLIARFRREARIVARLKSPATVTLHDFGRTEQNDIYMVLEYVDGTPLTRLRGERWEPARVVTVLEQALESVGEAHEHGIIHRDIKPGNLMLYEHLGTGDRLKILDFGIAKVLRALDKETLQQITGETKMVGTPRYLAPENAMNREPGPAADIYALGLVAYELLLDEKAVPGTEPMEILEEHLADDFEAQIEERPAVPEGLRRVINRMLKKSLDERYDSADQVIADLEQLPAYSDDYASTAAIPQPEVARRASRGEAPDENYDDIETTDQLVDEETTDQLTGSVQSGESTTESSSTEPSTESLRQFPARDSSTSITKRERPGPSNRAGTRRQPAIVSDESTTDDSNGRSKRISYPPGQTLDMAGEKESPKKTDRDRAEDDGKPAFLRLTMIAVGFTVFVAVALITTFIL